MLGGGLGYLLITVSVMALLVAVAPSESVNLQVNEYVPAAVLVIGKSIAVCPGNIVVPSYHWQL